MANRRMKDFIAEIEGQALGCFSNYLKTREQVWSIRFDTLIVCLAAAQNKKPDDVIDEFIEKYGIMPSRFTNKDVKKAVDNYDCDNFETTAGFDPTIDTEIKA